ncbi:hypothetical protein ACRAWD_20545 [Caulobacter segnis]
MISEASASARTRTDPLARAKAASPTARGRRTLTRAAAAPRRPRGRRAATSTTAVSWFREQMGLDPHRSDPPMRWLGVSLTHVMLMLGPGSGPRESLLALQFALGFGVAVRSIVRAGSGRDQGRRAIRRDPAISRALGPAGRRRIARAGAFRRPGRRAIPAPPAVGRPSAQA